MTDFAIFYLVECLIVSPVKELASLFELARDDRETSTHKCNVEIALHAECKDDS